MIMGEAKPASGSGKDFADFFGSSPASKKDASPPPDVNGDLKDFESNLDQLKNFQDWLRSTLVLAVDQSTKMGYANFLQVNLDCLYYYYGFLEIALQESLKPAKQQSAKNLLEELITHHKLTKERGGELMATELIRPNASQQLDYDSAISFISGKINELFLSTKQQNVGNTNVDIFLGHYNRFLHQLLENLKNIHKLNEAKKSIKIGGGYLGTLFTSGVINNNLFDVAFPVNNNQTLAVKNVMQNLLIAAAGELNVDVANIPEITFHTIGII